MRTTCGVLGGATAVLLLLAASSSMAGTSDSGRPASPADRAMMSGMASMQRDMDGVTMTGDPDRDFVGMMEPHHQGAIDMARVELRYGRDPTLRRMARDIIAAQQRELGEMQAWQRAHPG